MKKKQTVLLIFICFLVFGCAKKYTPDTLPDSYFSFGNGGGFAASSTEYTLLDNGQFFQVSNTEKEIKELDKLKRKTARQLYESLDSLHIDTLKLNQPGNIYYFISYKHQGKKHTITWGNEQTEVDQKIKDFYQRLNELTHPKN